MAGTKGKGGTCAFVDSILREYRLNTGYPRKVGLYTSPHLKYVRERIKINSEPLAENVFAKYFFEVWRKIESFATGDGSNPFEKLGYFRFLTLMSFYVFLKEDVTLAIYEAGVGGENDSTNIVREPVVTGITTLGIDHVRTLGPTIQDIAWHKAGIFKNGCPAFSVSQQPEALEVLLQRAKEKGVSLSMANEEPELRKVFLPLLAQRKNASLAIALVNAFLNKTGRTRPVGCNRISEEMIRGLQRTCWPGRFQLLKEGANEWYVDGAHTEDSLGVGAQWFAETAKTG